MEMLDKGLSHSLGNKTEQDLPTFHHATQDGAPFKTYELFISRIFPFNIFRLGLTVGD